ncbi:MAG: hypothetical protein KatS3mg131_2771 [Candidatus Tectimicrobiota bacterium]|nr:MAG: hypothetical protein KatS3mg131_2771 [Candidatus Tectomicrobia bacterium]
MQRALEEIVVVDLTRGAAGALATMLLADHGARVLRLLDSHDSGLRCGGYRVWDRGKESLRLPLTSPPAEAYLNLLRRADVLIEDLPPASPLQALVDDAWLARLNPRLVHCSLTAYGKRGPLRDEPPIDELVMARAGILASQPGFRPGPVHVVHPLPSVGAALLAALGIVAALLAREQTGQGRPVETSLLAGALLYHPKVSGERLEPRPFQTHPAGSAPFYSVYACADGQWIQLGCVHQGFINAAATVMGLRHVLDEPRFGQGRLPQDEAADQELRALIARTLSAKPYAEWARRFEAADVPFAPVRTTEEALDDPQVRANGMVVTLVDPEVGPIEQLGVPVQLSATPGAVRGPRQGPSLPPGELPADLPPPRPAVAQPVPPPWPPPLAGLRVLEITNLIAGPTAGRLLADLGAEVIKLEPPSGDLSRPIARTYFYHLNAHKRSLAVDPRSPQGQEVVQRLAATVDVVLANLRPGAVTRLGIACERQPRLILTHISGYGTRGPYAHRPGIDPLAQALIGLERAQGGEGNPPVFPAQLAPTDYTAGALAALGTLLALFVRARTGQGQEVHTNLLNGGILLCSEWFTRYAGRPRRPLADRGQYGLGPFHRLYAVKDGWIYVVAPSPAAQQALCHALGSPDLAAVADDVPAGGHANDTPLAHALAQRFASLSQTEALARLQAAGVPCAPVLPGDSEVFLGDAHALANDMVATYAHPRLGQLRVARHYLRFGHTAEVRGRPTPLLGEHTQEILAELGFSAEAIAALFACGAVHREPLSA